MAKSNDGELASETSDGWLARWNQFWFTPDRLDRLNGIRLLFGLVLFTWLLAQFPRRADFFSRDGWVDRQALTDLGGLAEELRPPIVAWSPLFALPSGWPIDCAFGLAVVVIALFTLGVYVRLTAFLTWLVVYFFTANPAIDYCADYLLVLFAFYIMLGYLFTGLISPSGPKHWLGDPSFNLLGAKQESRLQESVAANVAVRLIQIHMSVVILTSGFHKLQKQQWWSGGALYFAWRPTFDTPAIPDWELNNAYSVMVVFSLAAYLTMAWQISFPFLMWRPQWRKTMLFGALLGWVGSAFVYRLPLFGPLFLLGSLAFVPAEPWSWAWALLPLRSKTNPNLAPARLGEPAVAKTI